MEIKIEKDDAVNGIVVNGNGVNGHVNDNVANENGNGIVGNANGNPVENEPGISPQFLEIRNSLIPKDISFENVAGYKDVQKEISRLVMHLCHPTLFSNTVLTPTGFLLHGPPGCGKTLIVKALAGELKVPLIKVAAPELIGGIAGESEKRIRVLFGKALKYRPAILFIDEIDAISKDRGSSDNSMENRVVAQLLCCMDELNSGRESIPIIVIGATNQIHKFDPALRRAGRFDKEIGVGMPDCESRLKILQYLCEKEKLNLSPDICLRELARLTPGFVAADMKSLILEASLCAFQRFIESRQHARRTFDDKIVVTITKTDFMEGLKSVQPSSKREGFITVPDTTWDDIGSLANIRKQLQRAFLNPIRYQSMYKDLGLSISGGVLLYGPPGCGKTLMAKAVANEAGINFIAVNGPELLNMYVGGSEMAIRSCFQRARTSQPCVIFFDEIDAICVKRDGGNAHDNRVVNQLLTEMDGVRSRTGVFLMAATNRPDILDRAILRPGRFDKLIRVGVPKSDDRHLILKALTKNGTKPRLAEEVDLEKIAMDERCEDCTGADLSAIVRDAAECAINERLAEFPDLMDTEYEEQPPIVVTNNHFEMALETFDFGRKEVSSKTE